MGKIAFVFAGQGAQHTGMGAALYESSPAARAVYTAVDAWRPGTSQQCFTADTATLTQTHNAQPCLFATGLACAAAAQEAGLHAQGAAGFSLGEMAALAFCAVLPLQQAFALTRTRAQLMQRCAEEHPGAMAAVLGLDAAQVQALCADFTQVWPVNYNSPGQTVVAGQADALAAFSAAAKAQRARVLPLAVSGAFHSPFMQGATQGLNAYLHTQALRAPRIPLYANATAQPYTQSDAQALIARQASQPVLWQRTIENMMADGYDTFIEVGAGKTLTGIIHKISSVLRVYPVNDPATLAAAAQAILGDSHA